DRVPAGRRVLTASVWLAAVGVLGQAIANVAYARAAAPVRFETAFGVVQGDAMLERLFRAVRAHLVREADGTSLLYSYPDDAWLYLTVPAADATRYSILVASFYPPDKVQEIVGPLRAHRPGTVVVLLPFSSDSIPKVVEEEYDPVEDVGSYRIFVRRETAAP
ncbi:MAG TPA: hypothetical protein VKH82_03120, partial [Candidatus Binatia bacterium]|nr:hypothetical protein [Candidatus Binatia bacterium]